MYNALPLHLAPRHTTLRPPHFTLHHSTSKRHLWQLFQTTPHSTSHHSSASSHISYRTSSSRGTLFHFAIPYFKSHHIGHIMHHTTDISLCTPFHITCVPHNTTFHELHATISDHTIYWPHHLCIAPPHLAPHFTQHCIAFHMLPILHHSTTPDCDHTQFHIPLPCFT